MPEERRNRAAAVWLLIIICLLPIVQGMLWGWEPIDDAYISFRYARNWAAGHGLVFNVGERVEGYTNFLWTMLLGFSGLMGLDIVHAAIVMSCMFAALGVGLTWLLAKQVSTELGLSPRMPWVAAVVLALYPGWAYWALSGMEGCLHTCLLLGFVLAAGPRSASAWRLVAAGIFGVGAALTRWESVLIWPIGVACVAFDSGVAFRVRVRRTAGLSLFLAVAFGIYFYARYVYYGEWLPNTFYAKAGGPVIDRLPKGLLYTGEFGVSWLLPITGLAWLSGPLRRWTLILLSMIVLQGAYVTWTGGDTFAWLRFYLPVIPICAVFAAACIDRSARRISVLRAGPVTAGITVLFTVAISAIALGLDYDAACTHGRLVQGWRGVGLWLRENTRPDDRVAAAPIGAIGYYSERPIIDVLGLTDREVAHEGMIDPTEAPGHQRCHEESILRRKPEIMIGQGPVFDHPPTREETLKHSARRTLNRLLQDRRFEDLYVYQVGQDGARFIPYWIRRDRG